MDKLVSSIDILFKVALAAIAAYVSYQFGAFKQQNEDIKLVVDLAFAAEPRTATAGIVLAGKYVQQERIPSELYASIVASANSSSNTQLRDTANNGADLLAESAQSGNSLAQQATRQVSQALNTLPVRVYFQISREVDRPRAREIEDLLQAQGASFSAKSVVVPGIQLINQRQDKTEIRCFKTAECQNVGPKLVEFFKGVGVAAALVDLSGKYGNSADIRPYHFEVWFAALS
jgi:hypothetical protein